MKSKGKRNRLAVDAHAIPLSSTITLPSDNTYFVSFDKNRPSELSRYLKYKLPAKLGTMDRRHTVHQQTTTLLIGHKETAETPEHTDVKTLSSIPSLEALIR